MTVVPRRRVCAAIDVPSGVDAAAAIAASLEASETGFTRLGSGCVVVSVLGGEIHFTPLDTSLKLELRHADDVAVLQSTAQDLITSSLSQDAQIDWL